MLWTEYTTKPNDVLDAVCYDLERFGSGNLWSTTSTEV